MRGGPQVDRDVLSAAPAYSPKFGHGGRLRGQSDCRARPEPQPAGYYGVSADELHGPARLGEGHSDIGENGGESDLGVKVVVTDWIAHSRSHGGGERRFWAVLLRALLGEGLRCFVH